MTEQDLKYQDLKREHEALKEENERLRFSNSLLEKELKEQKDYIADSNKMVVTNADRIRSMSDEELADKIFKINEPLKYTLPFCENSKNNEKCNDILDSGELIPDGMCKQCLLDWLKEKVKQ